MLCHGAGPGRQRGHTRTVDPAHARPAQRTHAQRDSSLRAGGSRTCRSCEPAIRPRPMDAGFAPARDDFRRRRCGRLAGWLPSGRRRGHPGLHRRSYLFIEPRGRLDLVDAGAVLGLLAYIFTCSLIVGFGRRPAARNARPTNDESCCALRCAASATLSSRPTSRAASPT